MKLILVIWAASAARAHVDLSALELHLKGPLSITAYVGVMQHPGTPRLMDLTAFDDRAPAVCDLLLRSTRSTLRQRLNPTPEPVPDPKGTRALSRIEAFGEVAIGIDQQTLVLRAASLKGDRYFTKVREPAPVVPLRGSVAAHLAALDAVAHRHEPRPTEAALVAFGLLNARGEFEADLLTVPVARLGGVARFVTVARGKIYSLGGRHSMLITASSGYGLQLVAEPPSPGSKELRLVDDLDALGDEAEVAGIEVDGTLHVFTRR